MTCGKCLKPLNRCLCPDIDSRLKGLIPSEQVYVGNIIEERIADGLSLAEDYEGLNVHHPFQSRDDVVRRLRG